MSPMWPIRKQLGTALLALVGLLALGHGAAHAQANYRTVVIFGDTQTAVGGDADLYADFTSQIDWVIANKYTENIDFVLHVGDIINLGTFLPLPASCTGQPNVSLGTCMAAPTCDPAPAGCFAIDNGSGQTDCISCSFGITFVPPEWQRFTDQWSRLEPDPGSGWMGMPYAIVRGNHDNVGTDLPSELDVPGYNQYYGDAELEALEARFAGSDRLYEHLETYPDEDMDGHAWRFQIGSRPVLVVGPSYEGGVGTSQQQIDWVIDVFGRYPDLPGVLLIHDMMEHSQVYHAVVREMPTLAPNLFLAAQGHIQQDMKFVETIDGFKIMRTVSDWSRTASPGGSYFAILRFYFEGGQEDEVEAFSYSPVLDDVIPDADKTITKQVLAVPEPDSWLLQLAGLASVLALQLSRRAEYSGVRGSNSR